MAYVHQNLFALQNWETCLGALGANFSLQLSSGTHFAWINDKKNIPENQKEKRKKPPNLESMNTYLMWRSTAKQLIFLFILLLATSTIYSNKH